MLLGTPIDAPANAWTWVDFPDSFCDDGSNTGIGVNRSDSTTNVLIYLDGGGACWDYLTCLVLNTAVHGPFGRAQFDSRIGSIAGTVFDRATTSNTFKDWSFIFVPYCTGGVHAGSNIAIYNGGGSVHSYHHTGHANLVAFMARIAATFRTPAKVALSGSSAGGFGAALNYPAIRQYWPTGAGYMIDDSGPLLEGNAIPPDFRSAWFSSWRLDELSDPFCGAPCRADFSVFFQRLATQYPADRLALLSSLQDQTIRSYFMQTATAFQEALLKLSTDVLDPTNNFRYFFVGGQSHTMLGNPADFTTAGINLQDWLRLEVTGDPSWTSRKP